MSVLGTITVETTAEPPTAGVWDNLVVAQKAPLFYRTDVLRAYHQHPLRDVLAMYYLTLRAKGSRTPIAVMPAYLQPAEDPLRVLATMVSGFEPGGRPLLLSHVWHWYDTCLPARELSPALLEALCSEMGRLAADNEAQGFGFMNVAEDAPLAAVLRRTGRGPVPVDARHLMDLRGFDSVDSYLATLPSRARQDLRRHARLAARSGAEIAVEVPTKHTMADVAGLCETTAAKHGNSGWYLRDRLADFVCRLAEHARIVTVRRDKQLVAASISFIDQWRFHNWAAGALPHSELPFSPYMVLLLATIQAAIGQGCDVLEGGRRNDAWKHRFGFRRVPLVGWMQAMTPATTPATTTVNHECLTVERL